MRGRCPNPLREPIRLRVVVEYVTVRGAAECEEASRHHHCAEGSREKETEGGEHAEARDFGAVGVRCVGRGALGGGELVIELRRWVTLRMTG